MALKMQREWTPAQITTAVELWRRLADVYAVGAYERVTLSSGSHYTRHVAEKDLTEEWVTALVISDGERVEFPADSGGYVGAYDPVELSLIGYSDYSGTAYDAANVRALADTPGVTTSTDGRQGEGSATMVVGEMPGGDDTDTALGWLRHVVEIIEALQDYPLISDDTHDEYLAELADEAWGQWLQSDVRAAVESRLGELLLGDEEAAWDAVEARETAEEDPFREAFYGYRHPSGESWRAEGATSVVHPFQDEAVAHVLVKVFGRTDVTTDCSACTYGEH